MVINNKQDLRNAIRRLETLASILRMSGHPIALMPDRVEMATLLDDVAQFNRKCFDREYVKEFLKSAA